MDLKPYFDKTSGTGVLSTADENGQVDSAIYAKPHFLEDDTIAFIMRDRLSHQNLTSNPYAVYLFIERSLGYDGKRLFLKKVREEKDSELLFSLRRRKSSRSGSEDESKFLVVFTIEKILPLIGPGPDNELDE